MFIRGSVGWGGTIIMGMRVHACAHTPIHANKHTCIHELMHAHTHQKCNSPEIAPTLQPPLPNLAPPHLNLTHARCQWAFCRQTGNLTFPYLILPFWRVSWTVAPFCPPKTKTSTSKHDRRIIVQRLQDLRQRTTTFDKESKGAAFGRAPPGRGAPLWLLSL